MADGDSFVLLGDSLWLDFLNTTRGREKNPPDRLQGPGDWARWCAAVRLQDTDGFSAALALRAHLTDLATALATSSPPPSASLRTLNQRIAAIGGHQQLVRVGGQWQLPFMPAQSPSTLDSIARSAAETLALPVAAIRICAGPTCSLFLLDRSPLLTRRWCSPTACGRGMRVERRRRPDRSP